MIFQLLLVIVIMVGFFWLTIRAIKWFVRASRAPKVGQQVYLSDRQIRAASKRQYRKDPNRG